MIQNQKVIQQIVYPTSNISTDVIDNSSDNGKSDDATTGLDPEDNQQILQQESATELATVVPITIQQDSFLRDFCDNSDKNTFSRIFVMACGIVGITTPVLFTYHSAINFHPPYEMVFHSRVHWSIEHIVQHVFNTFAYGYQKP